MENRDPGNKTSSLTLRDGWWVPDADRVCFGIVRREVNDLQHMLPLCKSYRRVIQAGGNVGIWPKALAAQFEQVVTFEPDEGRLMARVQRSASFADSTTLPARFARPSCPGSSRRIDSATACDRTMI